VQVYVQKSPVLYAIEPCYIRKRVLLYKQKNPVIYAKEPCYIRERVPWQHLEHRVKHVYALYVRDSICVPYMCAPGASGVKQRGNTYKAYI
jgi:hypothetical protein